MDGDEEVKGEIDSCERRNVLVVDHVAIENVERGELPFDGLPITVIEWLFLIG